MLEQQRPIIITRENYRAFTKEKDLSKEEWAQWHELATKVRTGDVEMGGFIDVRTEIEIAAHKRIHHTHDWSDMVRFHDTGCVLKRAQLRAYKKWKGNKNE